MAGPKQTLHELEQAGPGERFQRLYRKRQHARHGHGLNVAFNVGGIATIAVGIATYPVPVIPSEIVILLGIALLAQGSLRGAKIMDGAELRLSSWFAPVIRVWKRWPKWLRRVVAVVWMLAVGALSYWGYRALTG